MRTIERSTKKKMIFPSHLQVSFYGDFLESLSSSSEVTIPSVATMYNDINWKGRDVPRCFTPINEI